MALTLPRTFLTQRPVRPESEWPRLLVGFVAVFLVLQGVAEFLGSDRGQAGLVVGVVVVAATLAAERFLFGRSLAAGARDLGLGIPAARGLLAAAALGLLLLLVIPAFARVTGAAVELSRGWARLVPGLFGQAGVAEEVLFRGYLFRHIRKARPFWRAAFLSAVPFVAVHLFLFLTLPWAVALAAVLLAMVLSFPLAYLFELGGDTIWAPAFVHFVVQGAIKVLVVEGPGAEFFPFVWMAASAALPFLVFLVPRGAKRAEEP